MKLLVATIFLIMLLVLPACENGVVMSYNSDDLGAVRFIKTEKLQTNSNELNCEYGGVSHQHSQEDEYYVYFTLVSDSNSPINPQNSRFTDLKDSLTIEFQKKQAGSGNFVIDTDIRTVGDIEFVSRAGDLKEEQRFNFLIDLLNEESCLPGGDKNACSLSGGLTSTPFNDMLNQINSALTNAKLNFDDENSFFIEDEFLKVKYMAISTDSTDSTYYHRLINSYIDNMNDCTGNLNSNKDKIECWLTLSDELAYRGLKNGARYHRKLWDGYIGASETLKNDTSKNKNLLFFTSGYEEAYYDTSNELLAGSKSTHTEEDFFNAITKEDNIPVFIAPQYRSNLDSFPDNAGVAPDGTDIDDKFYKLACLTNGAYFPHLYDMGAGKWNPVIPNNYNYKGLMGHIKEASYGTWRVKVKLDALSSAERFYEGAILVRADDSKGENITTDPVGYRIVR